MNPFKGKSAPTSAPAAKLAAVPTGPPLPRIDDDPEVAPLVAKATQLKAGQVARSERVADLERQLRHANDKSDATSPTGRAALALIAGEEVVSPDAAAVRAGATPSRTRSTRR